MICGHLFVAHATHDTGAQLTAEDVRHYRVVCVSICTFLLVKQVIAHTLHTTQERS
jgi:hypothetical protein